MKPVSFNITAEEGIALSTEHFLVLQKLESGLSYEQIAEYLGRPLGTVKSRINRARKALDALRARAAQPEELAA